jgi:outer membrane protein assembly factor BamB
MKDVDLVVQEILSSPASAAATLLLPPSGDSVFVAHGFDLYALDAHDGEILWQRRFDEPIWSCHLLDGANILVHLELSLACLAADGNEQWFFSHSEIITRVQIQPNRLRLQDFEERQFELDLTTGFVVSAT